MSVQVFFPAGIGQETGSWTPTFTFGTVGDFSPTYSTQGGFYLKHGRLVFIQTRLVFNTNAYTTASGAAKIQGLPYANSAGAGTGGIGVACAGAQNITEESGSFMLSFIIPSGLSEIQFRWLKTAATHVVGTTTHFPASTNSILIDVAGCYITD